MTELLQAAQTALRGVDWTTARARYEACLAQDPDSAAAWEGLGSACYWLQDAPRLFEARQQAYQRYRAQGDLRSAARVAVWLAADYQEFRGEPVVAGGWLERARQLLEGVERSIEHAWLRVIEGHMALAVENDPPGSILPAHELLGDLLMQLNRPAEALAAYQVALTGAPRRFNSLAGAARAARAAKQPDRAAEYYRALIELAGASNTARPELAEARAYVRTSGEGLRPCARGWTRQRARRL